MKDTKKTVLIVEDEKPMLKILAEKFEKEDFKVLIARDGKEGLSLALKEKPNLILLDIIMPRMDGVTMLEQLRQDKRGQDIPVIILTNLTEPKKISKSMGQGVKNFLIKTEWGLDEVVEKVKDRLG